jgi:hypothetical protein
MRTFLLIPLCFSIAIGCMAEETVETYEQTRVRPGEQDLSPDEVQELLELRYRERTNGIASGDIKGVVRDVNDEPIPGVTIHTAEWTTMTDEAGRFSSADVPYGDYLLTFEHQDYAMVQRGMVIAYDRSSSIDVHMLQKEPLHSINISQGGELHVGPLSLQFESGDLVFEGHGGSTSGDEEEIVYGEVSVSIVVFDPRMPGHVLASPAPLEGITADGDLIGLQTFGMLGVEMEQNGRPVNIGTGQTVTAKMSVSGLYEDVEAGTRIPMWHMDEQRGIWVQEGADSVVMQENEELVAVAELPHFSFWNFDRNLDRSYCATIKIPEAEGIRAISTYANSSTEDNLWSITGECNEQGDVSRMFLPGPQVLFISRYRRRPRMNGVTSMWISMVLLRSLW